MDTKRHTRNTQSITDFIPRFRLLISYIIVKVCSILFLYISTSPHIRLLVMLPNFIHVNIMQTAICVLILYMSIVPVPFKLTPICYKKNSCQHMENTVPT